MSNLVLFVNLMTKIDIRTIINVSFLYSLSPTVVTSSNESQQSILTTVQAEMAQRRKQKSNGNTVVVKNGTAPTANNGIVPNTTFMTRQDSRLSVKSLIESIENTSKHQTKVSTGSQSGSNTSLNNLTALEQQNNNNNNNINEKLSTATDHEKQQKNLNNNSITNNHNNILTTSNNVNVNGTQKSGGKQHI